MLAVCRTEAIGNLGMLARAHPHTVPTGSAGIPTGSAGIFAGLGKAGSHDAVETTVGARRLAQFALPIRSASVDVA